MTVRNVKLFELYIKPLLAGRQLRYLEIGVYTAGTTYWLWQNVLTHPNSTATVVDPWNDASGDRHYEMVLHCLESWQDRCSIFRTTSEEFYRQVPAGTRYDLVLVDGDHSYDAVMLDAKHVLGLVADESVVVFDDIAEPDVARAIGCIEQDYGARGFRRFYTTLDQVAFIRGFEDSREAG